ncbi:cytochrome c [Alisedimentitalea sp. MJ-SS2]|uniref:c-type cytochrome n=1 Tax=Aliisedimentitalea sp. MJ-SS2 TaxID=3049795 RepID=UPI00291333D8|nr:cytochrome c [Alisedimentitalea sp. MJ-SS2]MDU8929704.1 cytochrome c [Alisedimentitalea sp. MJ-SS2]
MKKSLTILTSLVLSASFSASAIGDESGDAATKAAIKARQAQMQLYAFNIGLLGGMAKGEIEYNADAASKAAANLAALSRLDQSRSWPMGSDNAKMGAETTAALPAIWAEGSDIMSKGMALGEAAAAMEQAAGGGLDALRGAIGPLGNSCGGCHKSYRQSDD